LLHLKSGSVVGNIVFANKIKNYNLKI